jgi:hypothetical protein
MGLSLLVIYDEDVALPASFTAALVFTIVGGLVPASAYAALPTMAPTPAAIASGNGVLVQASNLGSLLGPPQSARSPRLPVCGGSVRQC